MRQNGEYIHKNRTGFSLLIYAVLLAVSLGIISIPGFAADQDEELRNLAAELAKKRSRVETLSTELDLKKSQLQEQLQGLVQSLLLTSRHYLPP